jgi:hypothetical protein
MNPFRLSFYLFTRLAKHIPKHVSYCCCIHVSFIAIPPLLPRNPYSSLDVKVC